MISIVLLFFHYSLFDLVWCNIILYCITCLNFCLWKCILSVPHLSKRVDLVIISELYHFTSWVNSVACLWILYVMSWLNPDIRYIHIVIRFCQFTFLYKWLSILLLYVLSCTNLYEWLCILFLVFVMRISVRMTIHIIIDFRIDDDMIHISVLMTIHILLGYRNAHMCTNDYPYSYRFSSCTSLYKWLSILFRISSSTSLYEWLSILF